MFAIFATCALLQKIRCGGDVVAIFATRVLLQKYREEEVVQHGSCCMRLEKKRFYNKGLAA